MKLNELPKISGPQSPTFLQEITKVFRETAQKVNQIGGGAYSGHDNQGTAAPTTGTWAQGDFIMNSNPTVLGAAASQYVVQGFKCVAGGTPGTWVQVRTLTGT